MEVNYEVDQKTDGGIVYKQILINAKLQIVKRGKKTELTGWTVPPLKRRRRRRRRRSRRRRRRRRRRY